MTSLELLKEIEAWLCFNTEPSKEETAKLRKSINDHVTEQLNLHNVRNCTTCKFTDAIYEDEKCCKCDRTYSMWEQR